MIIERPVFPAVGTAHRLFRVVQQQNPDLLLIHREFDIHNLPGLVEDQQPRRVFRESIHLRTIPNSDPIRDPQNRRQPLHFEKNLRRT